MPAAMELVIHSEKAALSGVEPRRVWQYSGVMSLMR